MWLQIYAEKYTHNLLKRQIFLLFTKLLKWRKIFVLLISYVCVFFSYLSTYNIYLLIYIYIYIYIYKYIYIYRYIYIYIYIYIALLKCYWSKDEKLKLSWISWTILSSVSVMSMWLYEYIHIYNYISTHFLYLSITVMLDR